MKKERKGLGEEDFLKAQDPYYTKFNYTQLSKHQLL